MEQNGPDYEILEFAVNREIEACNFFMALAERVTDPQMRVVFEELAEEELEHKAKLELEIVKLGRTVPSKQQTRISQPEQITPDDQADLDVNYKDMLMLAMEKEEASFRTYVNLIPNVHDQQSREVLLAIAEEEVKHKLRFEMEYEMLLKKGGAINPD